MRRRGINTKTATLSELQDALWAEYARRHKLYDYSVQPAGVPTDPLLVENLEWMLTAAVGEYAAGCLQVRHATPAASDWDGESLPARIRQGEARVRRAVGQAYVALALMLSSHGWRMDTAGIFESLFSKVCFDAVVSARAGRMNDRWCGVNTMAQARGLTDPEACFREGARYWLSHRPAYER